MSENEYIGFAQNDKDEYIEGYLSDKEHFNGVLFLLKEPNTQKQKSFYFKDCVAGKENGMKNYIKIFNNLLKNYSDNAELNECAYANMIPDHGSAKESDEYKSLSDELRYKRINSIIKECNPTTIFLCTKDFDAMIRKAKIESIENQGVKYSNNSNTKRIAFYNTIKFYEIYHPNYFRNVKSLEIEPNEAIK